MRQRPASRSGRMSRTTQAETPAPGTETIHFKHAVRELMPELLRYFLRRLEDREDAADALSETLLVLWRQNRHVPADDEGLRRWAFGIARKVLSTARRGKLRRLELSDRLRRELAVDSSATQFTNIDDELRSALEQLSMADRELVLLVAWEGFGVAEAGAVLGLRPDAARARYSRARARLRALL